MSEAKIDEFPCIFPASSEFRVSETGSLETASSSGESANFRFLAGSNEQGCSVTTYRFDPASGIGAAPRLPTKQPRVGRAPRQEGTALLAWTGSGYVIALYILLSAAVTFVSAMFLPAPSTWWNLGALVPTGEGG
jgi:hypothetical protein